MFLTDFGPEAACFETFRCLRKFARFSKLFCADFASAFVSCPDICQQKCHTVIFLLCILYMNMMSSHLFPGLMEAKQVFAFGIREG